MSNRVFTALDHWHHTRIGLLVFGMLELGVSYLFASIAIDSGRLLAYALSFVLLVGALQNFVKLIRTFVGGRKHQASKT